MSRAKRIFLFVLFLNGCASAYGYDYFDRPNWDNRHAAFVGQFITARMGKYFDPTWCHPDKCVSEDLSGSMVRYNFTNYPYQGCTVWYEAEKATNIILHAEFRGTKQQCYWLLN